jgi:hypothetical protein
MPLKLGGYQNTTKIQRQDNVTGLGRYFYWQYLSNTSWASE